MINSYKSKGNRDFKYILNVIYTACDPYTYFQMSLMCFIQIFDNNLENFLNLYCPLYFLITSPGWAFLPSFNRPDLEGSMNFVIVSICQKLTWLFVDGCLKSGVWRIFNRSFQQDLDNRRRFPQHRLADVVNNLHNPARRPFCIGGFRVANILPVLHLGVQRHSTLVVKPIVASFWCKFRIN